MTKSLQTIWCPYQSFKAKPYITKLFGYHNIANWWIDERYYILIAERVCLYDVIDLAFLDAIFTQGKNTFFRNR
jgi:hypothetical protein